MFTKNAGGYVSFHFLEKQSKSHTVRSSIWEILMFDSEFSIDDLMSGYSFSSSSMSAFVRLRIGP